MVDIEGLQSREEWKNWKGKNNENFGIYDEIQEKSGYNMENPKRNF